MCIVDKDNEEGVAEEELRAPYGDSELPRSPMNEGEIMITTKNMHSMKGFNGHGKAKSDEDVCDDF